MGITRSLLYYHLNKEESKDSLKTEELLEEIIKEIFRKIKNAYGSRKIKVELQENGIITSRRKICKIRRKHPLIPSYTVKQYKVEKNTYNNKAVKSKIARHFDNRPSLEAYISDLNYVKAGNDWNYICLIIDLHNREVIESSEEKRKALS